MPRALSTVCSVLGMVLLFNATTRSLESEELSSGPGSIVTTEWIEEEVEAEQAELRHGSAPKEEDPTLARTLNLIIGMLLVILGFTIHTVIVSGADDIPVHLRCSLPAFRRRRH